MIKSLQIYNFQAHRKLRLDFGPGITTIKGPTDAGKSAILRSIRWLCLNDISGEGFISWGQKEVVAVLDISGDLPSKVARRKGQENLYKLNGQVFKAFGAGKVPGPIETVLGVNEINFQSQHDSPFWLASSAPEVSRQLNRVIDLSVIDQSLAKVGSFVRMARERVVVSEQRLREKNEQLIQAIAGTKRIEGFKFLKGKSDEYDKVENDCNILESILERIDSYQIDKLRREEGAARLLLDKAADIRRIQQETDSLRWISDQIDAQFAQVRELPEFGPIKDAWHRLRDIVSDRDKLIRISVQIAEAEGEERAFQVVFDSVHNQLEKVSYTCPVCGHRKNKG
jgi:hypothetical protein